MKVKIFLSYARGDDEPFVKRLAEALVLEGFAVWFDRMAMPSRQLTFHQEIRDAVVDCDRLVLLVGPRAIDSDYVSQEWQFAYFEANKCVNPIVRLNGQDAVGKTLDGYSLIPEDLRLLHAEDFRNDAQFEVHLANLVRQLSEPLPPVGKLVAVPELPPHFLKRREHVHALRDMVLADLRKPVVVSGASARIGVQGMGGIGKSVLAAAMAHHPETQRAFPDGIYWVTLGQQPEVADRQRRLVRELGGRDDFSSIDAGKERLRNLLSDRQALVILDDFWQRGDAEAFNAIGPRCRILLTTRDAGLVTALAVRENHYQVQLPTRGEAQFMLAKAAGVEPESLPPEAFDVVSQCDRLPLALALCGGMIRKGTPWSDLLEALREHDLEFLADGHPGEDQHANVWRAINVSVRALPEDLRSRYAELAVFGLDTGAPEAAVETLWEHTAGLSPRQSRQLLTQFAERSLAQRPREGWVELHDLLHNFAAGMAERLWGTAQTLHQRLLDAYKRRCPDGWPSGPNDGYFLENLIYHLIEAGASEDAVTLLDDLQWIEAKCAAELVFELQEDYRAAIQALPEAQDELRKGERREAQAATWINSLIECAEQQRPPRPEEIPASVEPWSDEQIAAEAKRIVENPTGLDRLRAFDRFVQRECYPLIEFGARVGFVAQHGFNSAPSGPVYEAGQRRSYRVGVPLLLRHQSAEPYDLKPALLRTLEGHTERVESVSVTPDGRRAVSGSWDKTLRVWDLETGACLAVNRGNESWRAVAWCGRRNRIVAGSGTGEVAIFELRG